MYSSDSHPVLQGAKKAAVQAAVALPPKRLSRLEAAMTHCASQTDGSYAREWVQLDTPCRYELYGGRGSGEVGKWGRGEEGRRGSGEEG